MFGRLLVLGSRSLLGGFTIAILFNKNGEPIDETNPLPTVTQLSGSNGEQDLRGLAADRPDADAVPVGSTYWAVDAGSIEVSDGTTWKAV